MTHSEKNQNNGILEKIKSQTFLLGVAFITTILTAFSQIIADNIKTGIDKARLRSQYFDSIACNLSKFNFDAETLYKAYSEAILNKSIAFDFIYGVTNDYSKGMENLRSNEFLYRAQISKGWGKKFIFFKTSKVTEYEELYIYINQLDSAVHLVNPIGLKIIGSNSKIYQLSQDDNIFLRTTIPVIKKKLNQVNNATKKLLIDM